MAPGNDDCDHNDDDKVDNNNLLLMMLVCCYLTISGLDCSRGFSSAAVMSSTTVSQSGVLVKNTIMENLFVHQPVDY